MILSPMPLEQSLWQVKYTGYGSVHFPANISHPLLLSSKAPSAPAQTHAALLLSQKIFPDSGYEVEVEYSLLEQLRKPKPNPWETFWLFFGYAPKKNGKKTNYILVKTNGIEAGKAWKHLDQSFALTLPSPQLTPQQWVRLRIQIGSHEVRFFFQDRLVGSLTKEQLFWQKGHLGLYVEDAKVAIKSVRIRTNIDMER